MAETKDAVSAESDDDMNVDSSGSDQSDDEMEERDEEEDARVLEQLQSEVETNPYSYDTHIKLIQHAKICGDLDALRQARHRASELFPFSEELWKSWIEDEIALIDKDDAEERGKIMELYEKSLKDYLSVDLWLDYAMFCLRELTSNEALQPVRDIFERALTAAGTHVAKGIVLWNSYLEVEKGVLTSLLSAGKQDASAQLLTAKQIQRIKDLYKRQFSVPLLGMDGEYDAYLSFIGDGAEKETQFAYDRATAKLEQILPFEKDLENVDDNERYKVLVAYIEHELSAKEPVRAMNLYERALAMYCLSAELWVRYLEFLDTQLKQESISLSAHERSIRNLPWVFELWPSYMRALELYGHDEQAIADLFSRASVAACSLPGQFVELWMSLLCFIRRRLPKGGDQSLLRAKFAEAVTDTQSKGLDPEDRIQRFWAWVEAESFSDTNKGREIWDLVMKNHQRESSFWLEYFQFERKFGSEDSCRKLMKKALLRNLDDVERVAQVWMQFEEQVGVLDSWMDAYHLCRTSLKKLNERMAKNTAHDQESTTSRKKPFRPKEENIRKNQKETRPVKPEKRKKPEEGNGLQKMDADGFKVPALPVSPVPKRNKPTADLPDSVGTPSGFILSSGIPQGDKKERTVFVSNLNYRTSEETLFSLFRPLGEIRDIRLAKDVRGRFRGFGFIEFINSDAAKEALKMDRQDVDGRPMYVSRDTEAEQRETHYKGAEGHEERKLFIRGLLMQVTKEDVATAFKHYDGLQDVRIVTHKNGTSKGLAYVEFNSAATARRALQEMDGKEIQGKPMNIAISNPPAKAVGAPRGPKPNDESFRHMRPVINPVPEGQRKSKSHVNLLPRAVAQKPTGPSTAAQANAVSDKGQTGDVGPAAMGNGQKSNADFRALFKK